MKSYLQFFVLIFIAIAVGMPSCKKKDTSLNNIRIAAIDQSLSGAVRHYRFIYDRNNNVDSITWVGDGASAGTSGFRKFIYFGSSYSITDEYANTFTVQANTSGQILKVLLPDTVVVYYKNGVVQGTEHKTVTTNTTQSYVWTGGNLTTLKQPGDTLIYHYDPNIGGQAGDPWRVDDLLAYGRPIIKTSHLPLYAMKKSDTTTIYSYQYDMTGRISRLMRVSRHGGTSDTATYNYLYY